jgi:hypothetical protein
MGGDWLAEIQGGITRNTPAIFLSAPPPPNLKSWIRPWNITHWYIIAEKYPPIYILNWKNCITIIYLKDEKVYPFQRHVFIPILRLWRTSSPSPSHPTRVIILLFVWYHYFNHTEKHNMTFLYNRNYIPQWDTHFCFKQKKKYINK